MKKSMMVFTIASLAGPMALYAEVFDNPANLQVLPEDISAVELGATMKSFSFATGYRCSDCHLGEEGQPLTDYDFASDEKELKQTARRMLKMLRDINSNHLEFRGEQRIEVQCMTCHRGVSKPLMTADVLTAAAEEGGPEGLSSSYRELRGRYYGTHSYDFSDFTLGSFAQSLAQGGKTAEAKAMLDLILEDNPDSFNAVFMYGELSATEGDTEAAVKHYTRAMELNPRAQPFIQGKLEQLKSAEQ